MREYVLSGRRDPAPTESEQTMRDNVTINVKNLSQSVRVLPDRRVEWAVFYDASDLGIGRVHIMSEVVGDLYEGLRAAHLAAAELRSPKGEGIITDRVCFAGYAQHDARRRAARAANR